MASLLFSVESMTAELVRVFCGVLAADEGREESVSDIDSCFFTTSLLSRLPCGVTAALLARLSFSSMML